MSLFLRCLGEAIAARGMRGLVEGVPFGGLVYDVAADVIDRYRQQNRLRQMSADLEQVVQAEARDLRIEIAEVAEQAAAGKAEVARQIESYLLQVPGVVQRSLRRPDDPRGLTVSPATRLDDPAQLAALLPQRLPKFRAGQLVPQASEWVLDRLLGAGGFGEVWLANHKSLRGQQRAFKFCLDREARERLLRHEGAVVQRVMRASKAVNADQQGIVPLLDAYLDGETPWLAYEYIDGGDLAGLVKASQAREPAARARAGLKILQRLAAIVGELHRLPEPVIHRDLKPANVLVKRTGRGFVLRVTDFGIGHIAADQAIHHATVSTPQASLGATLRGAHSPIYASPQQKRGHKPDVRDDVHALGVIGFQLLLADLQAERPSGTSWRRKVAACGLPDAVLDLLGRCWEDEPADRPADAKDLADQLAAATAPPPAPAGPTAVRAAAAPAPDDTDDIQELAREAYREEKRRRPPVRRRKRGNGIAGPAFALFALVAALAGLGYAASEIWPGPKPSVTPPTDNRDGTTGPTPSSNKKDEHPSTVVPDPGTGKALLSFEEYFLGGDLSVFYQENRLRGSWKVAKFDPGTGAFEGRFEHPFENNGGWFKGSVSPAGAVKVTLTVTDAKGKAVELAADLSIPVTDGKVSRWAAAEGILVWTYDREDKNGRPVGVVPPANQTRHLYRVQRDPTPPPPVARKLTLAEFFADCSIDVPTARGGSFRGTVTPAGSFHRVEGWITNTKYRGRLVFHVSASGRIDDKLENAFTIAPADWTDEAVRIDFKGQRPTVVHAADLSGNIPIDAATRIQEPAVTITYLHRVIRSETGPLVFTKAPGMQAVVVQVSAHQKSVELAKQATAGEVADLDRRVDELLAEVPVGAVGGEVRYNVACALSLGSRYGAAADRERRAARAVTLLTGLLDGPFYQGPTNAAHIDRDPDLDPIRSRADFRAFRARMSAPAPAPTPAGPGGAGVDSSRARSMRWTLRLNTVDGRDYVNQLAAMGAKVLIPLPPDNKKLLYVPDLRAPGTKRLATDDDLKQLSGLVSFFDTRPASVKGVCGVLGVSEPAKSFSTYFPPAVVEDLARKEIGYRNRRPEDIDETIFRLTLRGGTYDATVEDQKLRR